MDSKTIVRILILVIILFSTIAISFFYRIETFSGGGSFETQCQYCCKMLGNNDPATCAKNCIVDGIKCPCCK